MPPVEVKTEYFAFQGGLDVESPVLRVAPGALINCLNYEPDAQGGYRRPAGYERFDGRSRPSDAVSRTLALTLLSTLAAGTR